MNRRDDENSAREQSAAIDAAIDRATGSGVVRLDAAGVADERGCTTRASLLVEVAASGPGRRLVVLGVGCPAEIDQHPASVCATRVAMPGHVLIPGLVNAHTHLDLTSIGPRPFGGDFSAWLDMVRASRPAEPDAIRTAIDTGARLSLQSGVVAVGDIAGAPRGQPTLAPAEALAATGLIGVSFVEYFAIGRGSGGLERVKAVMERAPRTIGGVRVGVQPHATATVGLDAYRWAAGMAQAGWPISSHVAETLEEREFVARAGGPQRAFLERLGLWDDSLLREIGRGASPVAYLREVFERARLLLAHVNDASDEDIELLARTGQSVAYCPHASAYFGNHERIGPHRYRDMLSAGVNVCLGTDSIINQPLVGSSEGGRAMLSVWREMTLLRRRDGTAAVELLAMGTTRGAIALRLDPAGWRFAPGHAVCGVASVAVGPGRNHPDPLESAMYFDAEPELLLRAN